MRIAIVDDNEALAKGIAWRLQDRGHATDLLHDGLAASDFLSGDANDLVILDTPPALVVTDARIISRLADAVVYAVRWDSTPRGAVIEGLKELKTVNAPIAGLVLTMVNEARASSYAYDGYSYYRGRYKDYYVSE